MVIAKYKIGDTFKKDENILTICGFSVKQGKILYFFLESEEKITEEELNSLIIHDSKTTTNDTNKDSNR